MLKIYRFYFIFSAIICPSVLPHDQRQEKKQVSTNADCQMSNLLDVLAIYRSLISLEPSEALTVKCCQSVSMTPHLDLLFIFGRHMHAWFQYVYILLFKLPCDSSEVPCLLEGDTTSMGKISQGEDSSPRDPPPPPPSLPLHSQSASPPDPKSVTSLQLSHHHHQASSLEDDSRRRKVSSLITDPSLKKHSPPPVLSPPSRPVPSSAFDGIARAKISERDQASLAADQDGLDTSNGRKVDPVSNRAESVAFSMARAKARPLPLFRLPPLKPSASSPTTPPSTPPASETTTTTSNSQPFVPEVTPKTSSTKTSKRRIGARRRRSHKKKKKKDKKQRKQPTEKVTTALIEAPMRQVDGSSAVWLLVGCILGITIMTIWSLVQTYTVGISSQRNLNARKIPSQESLSEVCVSKKADTKPSDDSDKPCRTLDTGQNLNRNDTVRKRPGIIRRSLLKRLKRSRHNEDSSFAYSSASSFAGFSNSNNFIGVDTKKVRILEDNFRKPRSLLGTKSRRSRRKDKKYRKGKGKYFLERVQHQQSMCPAAGLPWMMTYPNRLAQPLTRAETTNSDSSPFSSDEQGPPPVDRVRPGMGSWEDSDEYSEAHSVGRASSSSWSNCSSLQDELAGPWVSTSLSFVVYDLDVIDDIPDEVMEVLCCDHQLCDVHPHDRYHYVGNKIIVQRLPLPNDTNDRATSTTFLPHVDIPPHATASPRAESRPVSPDQKLSVRMPAQASKKHKPNDDNDKPCRTLDTGQNLNRNDTVRKRPGIIRRSLLKRLKRSRHSEDSSFAYSSASSFAGFSNSNNFIGVDTKKVRILEDNFRKPRSLLGTKSRRSRRKGKKYRKGKGKYFLERVQHQQSMCPAAGLPWMMTYPNRLAQPLTRAETTNSDSSRFSSDEQGPPPVDRVRPGMGRWEDSDEYSEAHSVRRASSPSWSNCSSLRDELAGPWVSTSHSFVVYDLDVIDDIPDEVMEVLCCDQQLCDVHPHDRYHYVGNKIIVQRLPLPNDTNDRATSTSFLPHVDIPPHATASPRAESRPVSPDQKLSVRMPAQASKKHVRIVTAGSEDRPVDEICTDKPLHSVTDETVDQSVPNETVQITVTARDDDSDTYDIDVGGSSVAKFFEAVDAGVPYKATAKMVNAAINTDTLEMADSFSQTVKTENLVSSAVNTIRLEYSDQTSQTAGENLIHAAVNTDHARLTDSTCQTSSVAAVDKGSNTEHLPATDSWCQTTETATSEASAQTSVEQQDGSTQTAEEEQLPPLPPFSPRTPLVLTPASTSAFGVNHVKNIIKETHEQCLKNPPRRKRRISTPTEGQMDDSIKVALDKIREIYDQCIRDGAMEHLGTSTDMTGYPFAIGAHRVRTSELYAPWSICQTTKSPEISPRKFCPASPRPVPDKIQPTPTPPKRQLSQSNQTVVSPPRQTAHEKGARPRSSIPTCNETQVSASHPRHSLNEVQKSATSPKPNSSATQVNQNIAHQQIRMETRRVCSLPDTPPKEPRDRSPSKPVQSDACIMKMFSQHFHREMTCESGRNAQTGVETKITSTRCTSQLPPGHGADKPGLRKNDTTRTTPICTWAKPRVTGKSAEQSADTRSSKCEVEDALSKRTQNKPEESATLPFCFDNRDDQSERQQDHPKHILICPETTEPIPEQRVSPDKIPSCRVNSDLLSELKEKLAERRSTLQLNEESDVTQVELESGTETAGETSSTLSLSSQEDKAQSQRLGMATSSSQPRVCIIPQWNRESRSSQRVCIVPQQKGASTAPVEICITPKSPQKVCITPKSPHKIRITSEPIEGSQSTPKVSVCTQQKKDSKLPQRLSFIPRQTIIPTSPGRLQAGPLQNSSVFKCIENTQPQGDVKPLAEVDSASYFQTTGDSCLQKDIREKMVYPENRLASHTLNRLPSRSPPVWGNVEQIFENQRKESTDCKKSQFVSVSKTIKDMYERCMAGKLNTTANTQPKHNQTVTSPTRPDSEQFQGAASLTSSVNSSANRTDTNTFSPRKLQTEENNNEVDDKPIPVLPFVFPLGSDSKSGPGSAPPSDQDSSNSAKRGSSEQVQAENSRPSSPKIETKEPYRSLSKVSIKESSPPWEVSDRARNNVFSPVGWISPRSGITSLFRPQSPSSSKKMDEDGQGVTHQDDADKWQMLRVPSSESVSREKAAERFEEDGVQPLQTSPQQQTYCPFRPIKDSPFYEFPVTGMRSSVNRVIPLAHDVHARHTAKVEKSREIFQETGCNPGSFTPIEHQPKIRGYSKLPLKSKVSYPRFSHITKVAFPSKPKPAQFLIPSSSDEVGHRSEETDCREKNFSEPSQSHCTVTKTLESCGRGKKLRSIPLQATRKTETAHRNKETVQRCEKSETLQSSARNDKVLPNERPKNPFSVTSGRHFLCQFPNAINEELQKKMNASQKPSEVKRRKRKREIHAVNRREVSIKSHLSANDCNILPAAPQPKPRSRLPTSLPISREQTCKEDYECNHGSLLNNDTNPETCTSSVEETTEKYSPEDDTKSDVREPLILSLETMTPASDDGALLDIFQGKLNDNLEDKSAAECPRLSRIPVLQMLKEEKQALQPSNIRLNVNVDPKRIYSAGIESKASESENPNGTPGTRAVSSGNAKADLNQKVEWSHNSETSTSNCKRITSKLPLLVNISSNPTNLLKTAKAVSPAISQRIQLLQRSNSENRITVSRIMRPIRKLTSYLDEDSAEASQKVKTSKTDGQEDHIPQGSKVPAADPTKRCNKRWPVKESSIRYADQEDPYLRKPVSETLKYVRQLDKESDRLRKTTAQYFNKNDLSQESVPCSPAVESQASPGACSSSISILDVSTAQLITSTDEEVAECAILHSTSDQTSPSFVNSSTISDSHFRLTEELKHLAIKNGGHLYPSQVKRCPLLGSRQGDAEQLAFVNQFSAQTAHRETRIQKNSENGRNDAGRCSQPEDRSDILSLNVNQQCNYSIISREMQKLSRSLPDLSTTKTFAQSRRRQLNANESACELFNLVQALPNSFSQTIDEVCASDGESLDELPEVSFLSTQCSMLGEGNSIDILHVIGPPQANSSFADDSVPLHHTVDSSSSNHSRLKSHKTHKTSTAALKFKDSIVKSPGDCFSSSSSNKTCPTLSRYDWTDTNAKAELPITGSRDIMLSSATSLSKKKDLAIFTRSRMRKMKRSCKVWRRSHVICASMDTVLTNDSLLQLNSSGNIMIANKHPIVSEQSFLELDFARDFGIFEENFC